MPAVPGTELLKLAEQSRWDIAVILMTGRPQIADLAASVRFHAADFLLKPFTITEIAEAIRRAYSSLMNARNARTQATSLASAIERRTLELESAVRALREGYRQSLEALVSALDAREHETCAHSFRVRAYTCYLAKASGFPLASLGDLENAALLHDIGKIVVPDTVLLSPNRLTVSQFELMKPHAEAGAAIMARISFLQASSDIVRHHHERYDGSGYPSGLCATAIPLGSRIFALADTLDAMTSDRCYRKALPYEAARQEILRCADTQFDPQIVRTFDEVPESIWGELRADAEQRFRAFWKSFPPANLRDQAAPGLLTPDPSTGRASEADSAQL
jgi:putative nucleotidyltransferase with HDIG domain